jgi:effector-binding domain-containing protein
VSEVHVERVVSRPLAVASAVTDHARLGADIRRLLDLVWPVLRQQGVKAGRNVVVYRGDPMAIEAGVEIDGGFEETESVRRSMTPAGEAATTTHWGAYSEMGPAYAALEEWAKRSGRSFSDVSWEVYGHWSDDPSQVRTDIYRLLRP